VEQHTAARKSGITSPGTTFPRDSFRSLLAVINSSIPLVPISQHPSFTPFAVPPFRNTSSSTMPCFAQISEGRFICLFVEIWIGSERRRVTVVRRAER